MSTSTTLSRHGTPMPRYQAGRRPHALECGCSRKHHCAEALRQVYSILDARAQNAMRLFRVHLSQMYATHRAGV